MTYVGFKNHPWQETKVRIPLALQPGSFSSVSLVHPSPVPGWREVRGRRGLSARNVNLSAATEYRRSSSSTSIVDDSAVDWTVRRRRCLPVTAVNVRRRTGPLVTASFNPLMSTLKPQSNGSLYSNTMIGTLAVDGWTVTFGTCEEWTGLGDVPTLYYSTLDYNCLCTIKD